MNKYVFYLYLIFVGSTLLIACQRSVLGKQTKGMSVYGKQEFWYTLYSDKPHSTKPQVGDQVQIQYTMQKGDKVLSHSYHSKRPILVQIPQPMYDNYFTKAVRLMGKNDSLRVLIEASKARDLLGDFGNSFEDKEAVTFTYKMIEITTADAFEKELRKEISRIDSIKKKTLELIKSFSEGTLSDSIQKTSSGLHYIENKKGHGAKPQKGSWVQVHYICFLSDGTELQDSYKNMTPLEFAIGDNSVIDGWSDGLLQLNEGSSATLFVPPHLGYGAKGIVDFIPPNATLIFYVELLSVE